jgi:hypothetical protein
VLHRSEAARRRRRRCNGDDAIIVRNPASFVLLVSDRGAVAMSQSVTVVVCVFI